MKKKVLLIIAIGFFAVLLLTVLVLPAVIKRMGMHPDYTGQRYMLPKGKALIITTSHDNLGNTGKKTGVFGSEMTAPYYEFLDGRMSVDIASINGGEIPIDPSSFNRFIISEYDKRYLKDPVFKNKVKNSLHIDDLEFAKYDIIFLAGGWGAAYDLGYSKVLGRKITEAYTAGKIIGGVCHGPLGLLMANDENGRPLVQGRRITAVTDKQVKELGISITPQHPERELRAAGAKFESSAAFRDMFANHVTVENRIITGQNQNAGAEVANLMMKESGGIRR
ncbi:MAG TPA: type 1 glutamine amidotransferase domain-containing protein [Smithellaceae bacterium]|nr:type 1 glutamine amidotransferase domain-containing protein [Smithellaceae bacterium]